MTSRGPYAAMARVIAKCEAGIRSKLDAARQEKVFYVLRWLET